MGHAMTEQVSRARLELGQDSLLVWLEEAGPSTSAEQPLELPWFWIRDHSEDPSAVDPATKQRVIDTFAIDRSVRPSGAEVVDDAILVHWPDGTHTSTLSFDLLASLKAHAPPVTLWASSDDANVPVLEAGDVMSSDDELRRWVETIATWGFGLVKGCGREVADAEALANRIGYVRRSVFGAMWTLSSEVVAHDDSAYGNETLQPHTDGSYSHDGPGLQFFVCSERSGQGGESVLVDGFAAAEALRAVEPEAFNILTEVDVPARYIEQGIHLKASRPTIRLSPHGGPAASIVQVTLNNYDRAPFLLPADRLHAWYDAYGALHELVADTSTWWSKRLEPGDGLFFDNWRCLHGRLAYTGRRIFHGGYLNHEDFESRLRALGVSDR